MYSSQFTGIGRYTYELIQNLLAIDTKNHYVLFFNEPQYAEFQPPLLKNGRQATNVEKILVNAHHYSRQEQTKFLKILNAANLDLTHFTHFNAPLLYSKPSIVTIHDLTLHFYPGKKMTSPLHRLAYGLIIRNIVWRAKKVITVSKNTQKDLEQVLHTDARKVAVIYEGVHEDFQMCKTPGLKKQVAEKYGIDVPFLLYTGVWRDHKNVLGLIKAFYLLKSLYTKPLKLVITGKKDPTYAPAVLNLIEELGLETEILLPGLVDENELIYLMSNAEVFVFPSFYEGFGLPPLEAMKCGTPVAASNASCIPEICGEENAVFFNPHRPENMAKQIIKILEDEKLRNELIKNGLQHVEKFSWRKMAEETLQVYQVASEKGKNIE